MRADWLIVGGSWPNWQLPGPSSATVIMRLWGPTSAAAVEVLAEG
jgi:hypothetical protein